MAGNKRLNLKALDTEDLRVVAAALQDAVLQVGDMQYVPRSRVFTAMCNRYCWENETAPKVKFWGAGKSTVGLRVRSGLSVAGVLKVQSSNLKRVPKGAVAQLLTMVFEPSADAEDPGGALVLEFAGGGRLKLDVECLDVVLTDLSDPWRARARPDHEGEAQ